MLWLKFALVFVLVSGFAFWVCFHVACLPRPLSLALVLTSAVTWSVYDTTALQLDCGFFHLGPPLVCSLFHESLAQLQRPERNCLSTSSKCFMRTRWGRKDQGMKGPKANVFKRE